MSTGAGQDDRLCNELARALRNGGFGRVAKGHAWQPAWDPVPAVVFVLGILIGNLAALLAVGFPLVPAIVVGLLLAGAPFIIVDADVSDNLFYTVLFVPPVGAAIVVTWDAGAAVLLTNILPFAVGLLGTIATSRLEPASPKRTLAAVKSVLKDLPLLFPLVALVLFALILTSEIWEVANTENVIRLAIVGIFVIVPVAWQLRRTLVDQIEPAFKRTTKATVGNADPVAAVAHVLHADKDPDMLTEEERERVSKSFAQADEGVLNQLACDRLLSVFRRRVTTRLLLTIVLVGLAAFVLILALTWLTVADEVASGWAQEASGDAEIPYWDLFGLKLPLGPYVKVSALLATLAVAVFIAFVITNQELFDRFRSGYIERPAAIALLLAVPYVEERERLDAAKQHEESLV